MQLGFASGPPPQTTFRENPPFTPVPAFSRDDRCRNHCHQGAGAGSRALYRRAGPRVLAESMPVCGGSCTFRAV